MSIYAEFRSKNNQHHFKDINSVNKPTQINASFVCLIATPQNCLKTFLYFICALWRECQVTLHSLSTVEVEYRSQYIQEVCSRYFYQCWTLCKLH